MSITRNLLMGSTALVGLTAFAQNTDKPNIIFILCDDMGYGDLACYGQPYIQTPNIDRMASEGMLFTQAYAGSPVSAPSRATLMTGQHTGHTHVRATRVLERPSPNTVWCNFRARPCRSRTLRLQSRNLARNYES